MCSQCGCMQVIVENPLSYDVLTLNALQNLSKISNATVCNGNSTWATIFVPKKRTKPKNMQPNVSSDGMHFMGCVPRIVCYEMYTTQSAQAV